MTLTLWPRVVIHCAARVSSAVPYVALRKANVGGTRRVLALAMVGGTDVVDMVHVSTMGFLPMVLARISLRYHVQCGANANANHNSDANRNSDAHITDTNYNTTQIRAIQRRVMLRPMASWLGVGTRRASGSPNSWYPLRLNGSDAASAW